MKRIRRSSWTAAAVCGLVLSGATIASAGYPGDAPYERSVALQRTTPNTARLILSARQHPEVEVSRTLAAQPVYPWMAKVFLGDQTTIVDPLRPLRKNANRGLDEGHSLRRAQRLHNQLTGLTPNDRDAILNASRAATERPAGANQAKVIVAPKPAETQRIVRIQVIPRPQPSTPKPAAEPKPRKQRGDGQIALDD